MSDKKFLIFMPLGPMQYPALKYIQENNIGIIGFDGAIDPALKDLCDIFVNIDIFDIPKCLKAVNDLKKNYQISGALTTSADCHYTIAIISKELNSNLTWDDNISEICNNKFKTREFLRDIVAQPKSYEIESFGEIEKLYPIIKDIEVILKSPDSSGSRGFKEFKGLDEIRKADFEFTKSFSRSGKVLLEEKIIKTEKGISEISAEAYFYKDKIKLVNVVDRIFTDDVKKFKSLHIFKNNNFNSAIELGHINPTTVKKPIIQKIEALYKEIFDRLINITSLDLISLKLDLMIDVNENPILLEMTPRTSGGWDSCYSNIMISGNILRTQIDYVIGIKNKLEVFEQLNSFDMANHRLVVLGVPEANSENCIGRKFYTSCLNSLDKSIESVIESAIENYKKGNELEPISITK